MVVSVEAAVIAPRVIIPEDTDRNGTVTALDVLLLINYLNAGPLYAGASGPGSQFPAAYDVNRDGRVTPLDVLLVINYLNIAAVAAGEGESAPYPEAYVTASSASPSSANLPWGPSPVAAVPGEAPLWPASDSLDDAPLVQESAVARTPDFEPLEAALADMDGILDDIAEQVFRDWQQSGP